MIPYSPISSLVWRSHLDNAFVMRTLLLSDDSIARAISESATRTTYELFQAKFSATGLSESVRRHFVQQVFSQHGFGDLRLLDLSPAGGTARVSVSHYGNNRPSDLPEKVPGSLFDAGFAAGAAAFALNLSSTYFDPTIEACQSLGAPEGRVRLTPSRATDPANENAHPPDSIDPAPPDAMCDRRAANKDGLILDGELLWTRHVAAFEDRIYSLFVENHRKRDLLHLARASLREIGRRRALFTVGTLVAQRGQAPPTEDARWQQVLTEASTLGDGRIELLSRESSRIALRLERAFSEASPASWIGEGFAEGLATLVDLSEWDAQALSTGEVPQLVEAVERFGARFSFKDSGSPVIIVSR